MAKQTRKLKYDDLTRRMVRNSSDERAAARGDRFNPEAASFTIWWIERYCRLYEGEQAGEPLRLMSTADQPDWDIPEYFDWDDKNIRNLYMDRLEWHLDLYDRGEPLHWQYDFHIRLYGWQTLSEHFKRWVRRFREGLVFIAKKNCKSPTLAANVLYLTCGDGENGAKSFIMAKTGKQARKIAGQHIQEMLHRSMELSFESKFNRTEMRLYHDPTSSICEPLSSDNKKSREANEGINGNVCIDELHVVDRQTVDIVDRAGISRAESLHLEFSTAGKDNTTYGRERFDYGLRVQNSQHEDMTLCTCIHAAPQDVKPEELTDENVLYYARMANPAWNHTINPDELLTDFRKSRRTGHKLAEFMVYRLNIWRQSGDPFIKVMDWDRGTIQHLTFDSLRGKPCHTAFDMSDGGDLAAFAWNFEQDGKPHLIVDHWLPKVQAIKVRDSIEYFSWESRGEIRLLPGRLINQEDIYEDIMATVKQYDLKIQTVAYDPNRARVLAKLLEDAGYVLELFRQNNREFHAWIEKFESLVLGDEQTGEPGLYHNDSRILRWQVQHCQLDKDRNNYKRLIKPGAEENKKIDGIVAAVMSLRARELAEPKAVSAYESANPTWIEQLRQLR
jgi:phage terminase large subunit-like protein